MTRQTPLYSFARYWWVSIKKSSFAPVQRWYSDRGKKTPDVVWSSVTMTKDCRSNIYFQRNLIRVFNGSTCCCFTNLLFLRYNTHIGRFHKVLRLITLALHVTTIALLKFSATFRLIPKLVSECLYILQWNSYVPLLLQKLITFPMSLCYCKSRSQYSSHHYLRSDSQPLLSRVDNK